MEGCKFVIERRQTIGSLIELEAQYDAATISDVESYKERIGRTRYNSIEKAEVSLDSVKSQLADLGSSIPGLDAESLVKKIDSAILYYQNAMFHCCDDNGSSGRP
jgi:adenine-specific DNA methylase